MAWTATADVARFDEAVEWFLKRTVISGVQGRDIEADAQARSFWIGASLQLDQLQRVFDSIADAIAEGTRFEEWRERVRPALQNTIHAETVFRNATQRAYNAGRWHQMTDDGVVAFRPYFMYDAILDNRTTIDICVPRNETVLPWDHPWWRTNWAPLHHRCRSSVRNLTREQAEARGITEDPPDGDLGSWGRSPAVDEPWKPDLRLIDGGLSAEVQRKAQAAVPRKRSGETPPEHDPEHWIPSFRRFGKAASTLAWGKASVERGLDTPLGEARDIISERLGRILGPTKMLEHAASLDGSKTLRQLGGQTDPLLRGLAGLAGHLQAIEAREPWKLRGVRSVEAQLGVDFYNGILDASVTIPAQPRFTYHKRSTRASFNATTGEVKYRDTGSFVHEVGHALELLNSPGRAVRFLLVRTAGQKARRLSDLTGGRYHRSEVAIEDDFVHPYIGKIYGFEASEITSMGAEILAMGDRVWSTLEGWLVDSEHFMFTLGQLAGR
ncbi:MAG: phage minor head protein [Gammaproteobacteria bacterium]|nr:phage minor head protein [Gammaproteobacteria bacterium]